MDETTERRLPTALAMITLVSVLVTATGCLSDQQERNWLDVQPVEVTAHMGTAGDRVIFEVTNVGAEATVVERHFQSLAYWRGYAGAGKWSSAGERVVAPDFLVLVGEDGILAPWRAPVFEESFTPGKWSPAFPGSGIILEPNESLRWDLDLGSFSIPSAQNYTLEYQIYGTHGTVGPVPLPSINASAEADGFVGIAALTPRAALGHPWLSVEGIYNGPDDATIRSRITCADDEQGTPTGPAVSVARLVTQSGKQSAFSSCNSGELASIDQPVAPGDVFEIRLPENTWAFSSGAQSLLLALRVEVCHREGDSCALTTWNVNCAFRDGVATVREPIIEPPPTDGTAMESSYTAPPGYYMMGVEDQPWTCRADW